ncbi:sialate O-acetylesterase [Ottowia flava]|uniref:Sialate O-acetylesterase n=1 Tax=Ottowia flava TaxID=2675430 RepID=A0ABW4KZK3_9BURK|nr:sialate O-acetylesterase [Ottowia sp. GY511]
MVTLLLGYSMVHAQSTCAEAASNRTSPTGNLYIILGQSNAVGLASVKDVTPPAKDLVTPETVYPNVQIYGIRGAPDGVAGRDDPTQSQDVAWSRFAQWHPTKPGFGFKNVVGNEQYFPADTSVDDLFGPEIYLAHYLSAKSPGTQYILKLAVANTALADIDGHDGWLPGGHLYGELLKMVVDAQRAKADKVRLTVGALFFVQGESDASSPVYAAAYRKNLDRFITRIRADLFKMGCSKVRDVPFVMTRTQRNPSWSFAETVRRAQEKISRTVSRVKLINTDDFVEHMTAGANHFNERSQAILGERFFRALKPESSGAGSERGHWIADQ